MADLSFEDAVAAAKKFAPGKPAVTPAAPVGQQPTDEAPGLSFDDAVAAAKKFGSPGAPPPDTAAGQPPPTTGLAANIAAGLYQRPEQLTRAAMRAGLPPPADPELMGLNLGAPGTLPPKPPEQLPPSFSESIVPGNRVERLARAGAGTAADTAIGYGLFSGLPAMGGIMGKIRDAFTQGSLGLNMARGAGAGVGAQAASDLAPDEWYYQLPASLAGGALGAGAVDLGMGVGRSLLKGAQRAIDPFTETGRERIAGAQLAANPALTARSQLASLAPGASPEQVGEAVGQHLSDIDTAHAAVIQHARGIEDQLTGAMAGVPPTSSEASALQHYGDQLRPGLAAARQTARAAETKAINAIDPTGQMPWDMSPVRATADRIVDSIPKNAAPMGEKEAALFRLASSQPDAQPTLEVKALNGQIGDLMTKELRENGKTPAYARLAELKASIKDVWQQGVAQQAAREMEGAAAGQTVPVPSMLDRLQQTIGEQQPPPSQTAAPVLVSGPGRAAPLVPGQPGYGGGEPALPGAVSPPAPGAPGIAGGDRALPPPQAAGVAAPPAIMVGDQRVPWPNATPPPPTATPPAPAATSLGPTEDAAAIADRMAQANALTVERKTKFDQAPGVGAVLEPGRQPGTFAMPASEVAPTIFTSGKQGAERAQAFLQAGGDPAALEDYAAYALRKFADPNSTGRLDPGKVATWLRKFDEPLSVVPDVKAKFADVASAGQAVRDAEAAREAAMTAFKKSAAGKFLGDADPVARMGSILRSSNSAQQMDSLLASAPPEVRDGLKASAREFMLRNLGNDSFETGGMQGREFPRVVKEAGPALAKLFSDDPGALQRIRNLAGYVEQAYLKPPKSDSPLLTKLLGTLLTSKVAGWVTGLPGFGEAAGIGGSMAYNSLHDRARQQIRQLIDRAIDDPELAKRLASKAQLSYAYASPASRSLADHLTGAAARAGIAAASTKSSTPPTQFPQAPRLLTPTDLPPVSAVAPPSVPPPAPTPPPPRAAPSLRGGLTSLPPMTGGPRTPAELGQMQALAIGRRAGIA